MVLPALRAGTATAGEIVLFDRSWYNRSGVEHVMGFCSPGGVRQFVRQAPEFERNLVRNGIHLIKVLVLGEPREQRRRFKGAGAPAQALEAVAGRQGLAPQVGR